MVYSLFLEVDSDGEGVTNVHFQSVVNAVLILFGHIHFSINVIMRPLDLRCCLSPKIRMSKDSKNYSVSERAAGYCKKAVSIQAKAYDGRSLSEVSSFTKRIHA